jgi:hypothetical protein
MMSSGSAFVYIAVLFSLLLLSAGVSYQRYIVEENFDYFMTEEELPNQFDLSTYQL